jgi:hypothetical protein
MWGELSFTVCSPLGAVGVALLSLLSLLVSFSVNGWFVITDVENQVSSSRWKDWEVRETRWVRRQIQIVVFVLRV